MDSKVNLLNQRPVTAITRSKSLNRHVRADQNNCVNEVEGAEGNTFQTRVSDIIKLKNQPATLNSSVMEAWINETLKDAEHLEIPGIIVRPVHKAPLNRYKIDKLWLHS